MFFKNLDPILQCIKMPDPDPHKNDSLPDLEWAICLAGCVVKMAPGLLHVLQLLHQLAQLPAQLLPPLPDVPHPVAQPALHLQLAGHRLAVPEDKKIIVGHDIAVPEDQINYCRTLSCCS